MSNKNLLTNAQAFVVMQHFIDNYYWLTRADDIGGIASCLMLTTDGSPADSAFTEDWVQSIKVVVPQYSEDMLFTPAQIYKITQEFLKLYCRIGFSQEVQQLIDRMELDHNGNIGDQEIQALWNKALNLAVSNGPMYLDLK